MFFSYLRLGFEHIVPLGADHVLFVAGLFLSAAAFRPLVWQVSAFTVAHALTLGVVHVAPAVVEPLIALSIVAIAIENLLAREFHWRRTVIAFAFGLLHGLGFAGALQSLGLPDEDLVAALVAFNLGVEAGQLTVIAVLMAALGWCRRAPWYRARVVVPASVAIAIVGAYWAAQRLW